MGGRGNSGKSGARSAMKSPLEMTDEEIVKNFGEYRYHATTAQAS